MSSKCKFVIIPLLLAFAGFFFTTDAWIKFINSLSPVEGLGVYYICILLILLLLRYIGLKIGNVEFISFRQIIGSLLIFFSFFILFDFASCYQNELVYHNCTTMPINFIQTEDGVVYNFWKKFTPNIQLLRILTYIVTPFVLTLIGIFLIQKKVTLSH